MIFFILLKIKLKIKNKVFLLIKDILLIIIISFRLQNHDESLEFNENLKSFTHELSFHCYFSMKYICHCYDLFFFANS